MRRSAAFVDNEVSRLDAEYYAKSDLDVLARLRRRPHSRLSELAKITDGIHQSIEFSSDGPVRIFSAKHPKENYIAAGQFETVSDAYHRMNPRTALREGDVIVSTVGTIGNVAVVTDEFLPANSDRHIGIIRLKSSTSPYFISTVLLSAAGRVQTKREATGNVQLNLFISKLNDLLIPKFCSDLAITIARLTEQAYRLRRSAQEGLQNAEKVLHRALRLETEKASEELSYQRTLQQVTSAARFDAEYFDGKHSDMEARINAAGALGWRSMEELLEELTNGHTPLRHDLSVGEVSFLCAEHVLDFHVNLKSEKRITLLHHEAELARTALRDGDVLLTIKGKVGNAALVEDLSGYANLNQDVALLRFNKVLPLWWVLTFLNSPFGRAQVEQLSTGAINPFLGLANVRRIRVPVFSIEFMNAISEEVRFKVVAVRHARERAAALLERAKRAVDVAIEESEEAALAFLRSFGE